MAPKDSPFKALGPADWACIHACTQKATCPAGHIFFKEGDTCEKREHFFILINAGKVEISSSGAEGRVPIIRTLEAGSIFGLVGFLTTGFHTATCTAAVPTEVTVLSDESLRKIQQADQGVYTRLLWQCARQLADDIRACNERLLAAMAARPHP